MITKALSKQLKALWNDESAQGSTEYILLLVVVVAIVLAFKKPIMAAVTGKMEELKGGMDQIKPDGT